MPIFKISKRHSKKHAPSSHQGNSNSSSYSPLFTGSNRNQSVKGTSAPSGRLPRPPGDASYLGGFGALLAPPSLAPPPPIVPPNAQQAECCDWFVKLYQEGSGKITPKEFQNALINASGLRFSSSTVNYLMSIFEIDANRGIGFQEFESLWNYITPWREMFESFDIYCNGHIDSHKLGSALAHYNIRVGPTVLDRLVKKYSMAPPPCKRGPHGTLPLQIDLDRFICACVVVQQNCRLYERCNGHPTRISRDHFLKAVLSLP